MNFMEKEKISQAIKNLDSLFGKNIPESSSSDKKTAALIRGILESKNNLLSEEEEKSLLLLLENIQKNKSLQEIITLFSYLQEMSSQGKNLNPYFVTNDLEKLALMHEYTDEHGVTVAGRLHALGLIKEANKRTAKYLEQKKEEYSGLEIRETLEENAARIRKNLNISQEEWDSYAGQLKYRIDDADTLKKALDLEPQVLDEIREVNKSYRMRLTPYWASLILKADKSDPIFLQSVPTIEMIKNKGDDLPAVASDHSPARLIDQLYPQVLTIKSTNMCAMYCTHCLRIMHIGKKDQAISRDAYRESISYIRSNKNIRDVLITGGDAFTLSNENIKWILSELDEIDHVKTKRLGTRLPVTTPQRIDNELLEILSASNEKKPIRVPMQINCAREITPKSKEVLGKLSKSVSALLDQIVLLKGVNDTKTKMWKLCETLQENYVRPYYVFNCSPRNKQFSHLRVPTEVGQEIIESMYGNISGDAIPRYIAAQGGKIPLHRTNVVKRSKNSVTLKRPWDGSMTDYPDRDPSSYS